MVYCMWKNYIDLTCFAFAKYTGDNKWISRISGGENIVFVSGFNLKAPKRIDSDFWSRDKLGWEEGYIHDFFCSFFLGFNFCRVRKIIFKVYLRIPFILYFSFRSLSIIRDGHGLVTDRTGRFINWTDHINIHIFGTAIILIWSVNWPLV